MKKSYVLYAVIFVLLLQHKTVVKTKELSHICAYSNQSVVKFRDAILKQQAIKSLDHPGVMLDWPIDLCEFWISSLYGPRKDPVTGKKKMHNGVDMAAVKGTTIKAAGSGTVKSIVKNAPGYGNMVEIEHSEGDLITRYAHLDTINVKAGMPIKKGRKIGTVGATGNVRGKADASHLHLEILYDGKRVNPLHYLYWAETGYKKIKNSVY